MSLFSLDISELLGSPVGTLREFHFEQALPDDTFLDVICRDDLIMNIKLVHQTYGIECLFISLSTRVDIVSESIEGKEITLTNQSREFHLKKSEKDTDDIRYIDTHELIIELREVIEEELLIAGL